MRKTGGQRTCAKTDIYDITYALTIVYSRLCDIIIKNQKNDFDRDSVTWRY